MRWGALVGVLAALVATPSFSAEVYKSDDATVDVGGRLQTLAFTQRVYDPARADGRLYLFAKQARVMLGGSYQELRFNVGIAFAGEEEIKAPSPGISLSLLDFQGDAKLRWLGDRAFVRVGQMKVPYSRERLTDSGDLAFIDRSINSLGFRLGRDVGGALHAAAGPVMGVVGIYTGGGRDIPERYLPQILGFPMLAARVGVDTGVDVDAFSGALAAPPAPWKAAPGPSHLVAAAYLNAVYMRDSLVGHSTVLNVRASEKPLLLNANWNPYIGQAPFRRGELFMFGGDAAAKMPFMGGTLAGELEGNFARFNNVYGAMQTVGGRVQVSMSKNGWQGAARYAVLFPDAKFQTGGVSVTGGGLAIQEVTPSIAYSMFGGRAKLVFDVPLLINVPVAFENNIGAYVLTEQPDSASVVKTAGNSVGRQNVIEARAMVQGTF